MRDFAIVANRYRIEGSPIGEGGMGVVYKAVDLRFAGKFVALKTIKGSVDSAALDHFRKEWDVLSRLCHPNIIDVLDVGEMSDGEEQKPFFVMPLLSGQTLDKLIRYSSHQLTEERVVQIVAQVCRGLQAAHEQNLVHRDLKPSNLFVLSDDSVKIIDFGVVHFADGDSRTALKGTPQYMAPEQFEDRPITAQSDLFSLGVICYEALTGRKPFEAKTFEGLAEAIRRRSPIPALELNPALTPNVARAIHKALAKQPYQRFASAREFADVLQRAVRNEPIEVFDRTRIGPRVNRIKKALAEGDHQYALDLVGELESEGNLDNDISFLRIQAEQGVRTKMVQQLLDGARSRMEEEEYPLALQKVQNVLDLDPGNIDALALRAEIERKRSTARIDQWQRIADQHFSNGMFPQARQAVEEILRLDPNNAGAKQMLTDIGQKEREYARLRQERQQLYSSALTAYKNGDISSAYKKLQKAIELGKQFPVHPNTEAQYFAFYEQIRSERDEMDGAYSESKAALDSGNFEKALKTCNQILRRRPNDARFQALKIDIEDRQRQSRSAALAELHTRIESEPDLEKKYQLLRDAVQQHPEEQTFSVSLKLVREKRDLVNAIVSRARVYETRGQFSEALGQWDILRTIYEKYPGLEYEISRVSRLQEERVREEALRQQDDVPVQDEFPSSGNLSNFDFAEASAEQNSDSAAYASYQAVSPEITAPSPLRQAAAAAGAGPAVPGAQSVYMPIAEPFAGGPQKEERNPSQAMQPQLSSVFPLREPISQQAEPRAVAATLVRAVEDEPRLPGRSRRVILALSVAAVVIIGVVTGLKFWPSSRQAALIAKATPVEQSPHALRASTSTSNPQPKQSDSSGSSLQGKIVPPALNPESKSQPAVRTVEFTLDSEPTGAKAKIDDERTCTTPCMLRLAPGPHDVILFAENHKTTERAFDISSGDAADNLLRVTLPEATESWVIVTKPDKLSVEVDGKLKGPAPITIDLTVGQHQLRVYGNVGEHTETVDVAASDTEAIQHRCISLSADSPCPSPKPGDSQPGPSQQSN